MGTAFLPFAAWLLAAAAPPHHGQYRGPADEVFAAGGAVPGAAGGSGAATGGLGDPAYAAEGFNRWEFWFEWNKDILLRVREPHRAELPPLREGEAARVDPEFARREILPLLVPLAESPDPHVAHAAILAIGKIGGPESLPTLFAALATGGPETRRFAALALGNSGERGALLPLVQAFENPSAQPELRTAAAIGMGLQGRREASPILRNYLQKHLNSEQAGGDGREVLLGALTAVGMLRDPSFAPLLVGRTREMLEERKSRARYALAVALGTLGRLREPAALPTLVDALQDKDIEIRRAAALALGDLGDAASVAPLATALASDSDLQVRGFAAVSLGRVGGDAAAAALRSAFSAKGVSRTVRGFSAIGLGLAWDRASASELRRALESPGEEDLRGAYAIALGFLGEQSSVATLFSVLEARGADPDLRGYAAIAIGMIRPDEGLPKLLRTMREDSDRGDDFRRGLLLGIALYGDPSATPGVAHVLAQERRDGSRAAATVAINLLRDPAALEPLEKLLEGSGPSTPPDRLVFAVSALGSLGDAHSYPILSEAFFNANYRLPIPFYEPLADLL